MEHHDISAQIKNFQNSIVLFFDKTQQITEPAIIAFVSKKGNNWKKQWIVQTYHVKIQMADNNETTESLIALTPFLANPTKGSKCMR